VQSILIQLRATEEIALSAKILTQWYYTKLLTATA